MTNTYTQTTNGVSDRYLIIILIVVVIAAVAPVEILAALHARHAPEEGLAP